MRFWDTSALIPVFVFERETARVRSWFDEDPVIVVWTLTRVELRSAFARRRREDASSAALMQAAQQEVFRRWESWTEITGVETVRGHAERLVERYPLRAGDALQLGAALVAAGGDPGSLEFVSLDDRQVEAARSEGLRALESS